MAACGASRGALMLRRWLYFGVLQLPPLGFLLWGGVGVEGCPPCPRKSPLQPFIPGCHSGLRLPPGRSASVPRPVVLRLSAPGTFSPEVTAARSWAMPSVCRGWGLLFDFFLSPGKAQGGGEGSPAAQPGLRSRSCSGDAGFPRRWLRGQLVAEQR